MTSGHQPGTAHPFLSLHSQSVRCSNTVSLLPFHYTSDSAVGFLRTLDGAGDSSAAELLPCIGSRAHTRMRAHTPGFSRASCVFMLAASKASPRLPSLVWFPGLLLMTGFPFLLGPASFLHAAPLHLALETSHTAKIFHLASLSQMSSAVLASS